MSTTPTITREQLAARLATTNAPLIVDVLPAEEFLSGHLPGAVNACVFNMTFLEDVAEFAPDRSSELVVYGVGPHDMASSTAAEKLAAAGYTRVIDFRGGLEDWLASGGLIEGDAAGDQRPMIPADGIHQVHVEKSIIEWTGRNLTGAHSGTIRLSEGEIEVAGGLPLCGKFTLDMQSIRNADLEDSEMHQLLLTHLMSEDFFEVHTFPTAEFRLSKFTPMQDAKPGNPNFEIVGELEMKGVSHGIAFPAILAPTPDGLLAADAHLDIDRTRWNVVYGSGKFYAKLGKHLVHDEISISLKLVTH